jgi:hypothetical protein
MSESHEFVFKVEGEKVNFDDLELIAGALRQFTREEVIVLEYFEVRTSSSRVAAVLEGLLVQKAVEQGVHFDLTGDAAPAVTRASAPKSRGKWKETGQPIVATATAKPAREWKVWSVIQGNESEKITKSEVERRLQAGEFDPGTVLRHPKSGAQEVIGDKVFPQRLVPAIEY